MTLFCEFSRISPGNYALFNCYPNFPVKILLIYAANTDITKFRRFEHI